MHHKTTQVQHGCDYNCILFVCKALVVKMQEDLTERATKQLQAIAAFEATRIFTSPTLRVCKGLGDYS